jgi:hypothetical protein
VDDYSYYDHELEARVWRKDSKRRLHERKMSLRTVTVDKAKLIETVEKNKEFHAKEYEETWAEYVKAIRKALDVVAEQARDNVVNLAELNSLPKPRSYVDDYEEALEILRWEVGEQVELDRDEFKNYVLDDWNWKAGFETSKSTLAAYNGPYR